MKKNFKTYVLCWAILLAVFNIICFVPPRELAGYEKFGGAFWTGYVFIVLAFAGQLACAYFAFRAENAQKLFYKLPLITVSYTGLLLTLLAGGLCMAIPDLPDWIGIIACVLILAFTAIAVIKANAAGNIVSALDAKTKEKTQFIRSAAANAQNIMNRAQDDAAKAACKRVYEALRYADPMSSEALAAEEAKISAKLDEFSAAVQAGAGNTDEIAQEIVLLVKERNNKCKALK